MAFYCLTIRFTDTFNFILLLNGVTVGRTTRGVDELLRQALGHGLQVAETSFSRSGGQQVQSVVDASERGHIDGLTTHHTRATHAGRVLSWTRIDNGVHHNLNRVLVREQVDNFERVLNDAHRHELLSGVASLSHETAGQTLHNRARGLAEAFLGVSTRRVRQVRRMIALARNVVLCGLVREMTAN